jgi:hypothetical protein
MIHGQQGTQTVDRASNTLDVNSSYPAMSQSFDYDAFGRLSLGIIVHSKGKSFAQLVEEIEALRQKYNGISDGSVRKYIRRNLDRRLLMFAIDTAQPRVVVDRLYSRIIRQGFNDLHAEVASAIEYADYCSEQGNVARGLRELYKVRQKIHASEGISHGSAQNFLQEIEAATRHFEENR